MLRNLLNSLFFPEGRRVGMKTKFLLRIPSELKEKLAMAASRAGISINALVIFVLWRYLRKEE